MSFQSTNFGILFTAKGNTKQSHTADTDVPPVWLKSAEFAHPGVLISTFKNFYAFAYTLFESWKCKSYQNLITSKDIDISAQSSENGETSLMHAISIGNHDLVKVIINSCVNP